MPTRQDKETSLSPHWIASRSTGKKHGPMCRFAWVDLKAPFDNDQAQAGLGLSRLNGYARTRNGREK